MTNIADSIEVDPEVHHGRPVIEGTRIPVHMVRGLLGKDLSIQEIIDDYYPNLTKEEILACVRYAESLVEDEEVHPVGNKNPQPK